MENPKHLALFSFLSILGINLFAASTDWNGTTDTDWSNDANWSAGAPANVDTAVFTGAPTVNQPDIGTAKNIRVVDFQSAGWTITSDNGGSLGNLNISPASVTDGIFSAGVGTNVINANLPYSGYNSITTINADTGNTLVIAGNVSNSNRNWQTTGMGNIIFSGDITNKNALQLNGDGSYWFNGSNKPKISTGNSGNIYISSGNTFGGTSDIGIEQYKLLVFQSGATLSPGANDGYNTGLEIASVIYDSSSGNRAGLSMTAGSFLAMDLGTSAGVSDQIIVGAALTDDFGLGGATLALYGDAPQDGIYTLLSAPNAGATITGTFDSDVYLNDSILDPSFYTLDVSGTGVSIELTGIIPEPTTYALIVMLSMGTFAMMRRRRS